MIFERQPAVVCDIMGLLPLLLGGMGRGGTTLRIQKLSSKHHPWTAWH